MSKLFTHYSLLFTLCYLVGSIPTAYIFGKIFKGIDIFKYGSGNPGATNVFRVVGKTAGILTLLIDFLKGFIPVIVTGLYKQPLNASILCGLFLILGHIFPIFLKFKGGKGAATSAGVCFALIPVETIFGLIVFMIVFLLTRYVSAASIAVAIFVSALCWFNHQPLILSLFISLIGIIIIYRHKNNIVRILNKTENKIVNSK